MDVHVFSNAAVFSDHLDCTDSNCKQTGVFIPYSKLWLKGGIKGACFSANICSLYCDAYLLMHIGQRAIPFPIVADWQEPSGTLQKQR